MNADTILQLSHVRKVYPGVVALDDLNIDFRRGEVHAIAGENGAGKSTMIKVIAGAIAPEGGTIVFDGESFNGLTPTLSGEKGVRVVYQEFNLMPGLSVAENIFIGEQGKFFFDKKAVEAKAQAVLDEWGLDVPASKPVMQLTVGYQQLVEIVKAISAEDVRVLIMDEPTAPLTDEEVDKVYEIIRKLKQKGVAIIYVSHRLEELFEISDRISVLRDGKYITTVETAQTTRQELVRLMVGRELTDDFPPRKSPIGEEVLRAEQICGNRLENISFTLRKGEILGFAGLLGCGRTELMELISGVKPITGGQLTVNGKSVHFNSPTDANQKGITMITEDRKRKGFFGGQSIEWNITISCVKRLAKGLVYSDAKLSEVSNHYYQALDVKASGPRQQVQTLSGGNQQKVVIAKSLATGAEILIFDEPTRGIDVGAKAEIYKLIRKLSEEGKSILLVSSEMKEVIGLSDRIIVLSELRQAGELEPAEFTQERILELATMHG